MIAVLAVLALIVAVANVMVKAMKSKKLSATTQYITTQSTSAPLVEQKSNMD